VQEEEERVQREPEAVKSAERVNGFKKRKKKKKKPMPHKEGHQTSARTGLTQRTGVSGSESETVEKKKQNWPETWGEPNRVGETKKLGRVKKKATGRGVQHRTSKKPQLQRAGYCIETTPKKKTTEEVERKKAKNEGMLAIKNVNKKTGGATGEGAPPTWSGAG